MADPCSSEKTMFGDRCRVISDQGDYSSILRLTLEEQTDLVFQVCVPRSGVKADIFLKGGRCLGDSFHQEFTDQLRRKLDDPTQPFNTTQLLLDADALWAQYKQADASLVTAIQPLSPAAKSNRRRKAPRRAELASDSSAETTPAKMKTSWDVINRLRWDAAIPTADVVVGYTDRFVGVVEKPFEEFRWDRFADTDPEDTASIPQHRIRYFRFRDTHIWDRQRRIDLVFGSCGPVTKTLAEVIHGER